MAKIRLSDIASRCNVTPATVSRILNQVNTSGFSVRPEVRERVLRVANELRYCANFAGRALATRKTGLVFVLGLRPNQFQMVGIYESILWAVQDRLLRRGYNAYVGLRHSSQSAIRPPSGLFDGVLLLHSSQFLKAEVAILDDVGLPYVGVNCQLPNGGPSIQTDDRSGVEQALAHLLALGHRWIAYCPETEAVGPGSHPSRVLRREVFAEGMARAGLTPVVPPGGLWPSTEAFVREAVVDAGATAVLAYDARVARELIYAARNAGLSIPNDLSVICFNDLLHGAAFSPAVTALSLPTEEMGAQSVDLLLRLVEDGVEAVPEAERRAMLPVKLMVRETTAAPALRPAKRRRASLASRSERVSELSAKAL